MVEECARAGGGSDPSGPGTDARISRCLNSEKELEESQSWRDFERVSTPRTDGEVKSAESRHLRNGGSLKPERFSQGSTSIAVGGAGEHVEFEGCLRFVPSGMDSSGESSRLSSGETSTLNFRASELGRKATPQFEYEVFPVQR